MTRTTDVAARVPYELVLYHECDRFRALPFPGSLLDQPHLLLTCFRIIDDEISHFEAEKRKLEEINRQQWEMFNQQSASQN